MQSLDLVVMVMGTLLDGAGVDLRYIAEALTPPRFRLGYAPSQTLVDYDRCARLHESLHC